MRLRRRPVPCSESLLHVAKDLGKHDYSKMNQFVLVKSPMYEHSWNMHVHILITELSWMFFLRRIFLVKESTLYC